MQGDYIMVHNQDTLTTEKTTSPNGESQDKEMSEKQQAAQHILNAMVIVELMIDIFKNKDDQEACIVVETLDILPKLESNLEKSYALMH